MDNGITPVMNVGGYGNGYGAGAFGGEWIFGLIVLAAMMNGGFGGWGGNRGFGFGADEMSNSLQTNILEAAANQRENCSQFTATNSNITNGFYQLARDMCQQSFGLVNQISGVSADIKDRLATMAAAQAQCCCDTDRAILENRYLSAQNTAAINANTSAGIQSIKDLICAEKAERQAARIQQLELNQALCGVVRYPTTATFSAGYPFSGFGYGYGNSGCGCGGSF